MIGANVNLHLDVGSAVIGGDTYGSDYLAQREDGLSKYRETWGVGGGHRQESVVTIAVTWSGQHAELFCCLKQSHTNEEASLWPCGRECQP